MSRHRCPLLSPRLIFNNADNHDTDDDMQDDSPAPWGPWCPSITPLDRAMQFGALAGLLYAHFGPPGRPAVEAMLAARHGDWGAAVEAWDALRSLQTVRQRRVIASFGSLLDIAESRGPTDAA